MTSSRKLFTFLIVAFSLLVAVSAGANEGTESECHYEVTQVWENGVLVSETKVRRCTEETVNSTKFDPDNNFGDYVKKKAVDHIPLAIIIALAKD